MGVDADRAQAEAKARLAAGEDLSSPSTGFAVATLRDYLGAVQAQAESA
jgi:hypothetical protein